MRRRLIQKILKVLATTALKRHKPHVIAVTGTVGKTSAKEAIALVLGKKYGVRKSEKNYNNEVGVPLTILGIASGGSSFFGWVAPLARGFWNAFFAKAYSQVLVLEFGIEKPGDMAYLTGFVKLDYALITAFGETPVHVEFFKDREQLWDEKLAIARGLKPEGVLFFNADDAELARRAPIAALYSISFGISPEAHMRSRGIAVLKDERGLPVGISCTLATTVGNVPLVMPRVVGVHQYVSVLAAAALGVAMEVPNDCIREALEEFQPPPGRLHMLEGARGSFVFDDTYNASPASMIAALEVLAECAPKKRIAVLGDMLELGVYTEEAHRSIGRHAAHSCDVLFTVGARAKFIADEAARSGFPKTAIHEFDASQEVGDPLELMLKKDDVVLVKGSQSMRMEKIVEEIMAEPQRSRELLVRQDENWKRV